MLVRHKVVQACEIDQWVFPSFFFNKKNVAQEFPWDIFYLLDSFFSQQFFDFFFCCLCLCFCHMRWTWSFVLVWNRKKRNFVLLYKWENILKFGLNFPALAEMRTTSDSRVMGRYLENKSLEQWTLIPLNEYCIYMVTSEMCRCLLCCSCYCCRAFQISKKVSYCLKHLVFFCDKITLLRLHAFLFLVSKPLLPKTKRKNAAIYKFTGQ